MKHADVIKIFILGAITALLLVRAFDTKAEALDSVGSKTAIADHVIVKAVADARETHLFLIDPNSFHIAHYSLKAGRLGLRNARYYRYDLGIHELSQDGSLSVSEARAIFEKDLRRLP